MNLNRVIPRVIFIAAASPLIWAQTTPLAPSPIAPKPFQFDGSQYKLLLPGRPVMLRQNPALRTPLKLVTPSRPCAAARVVKPNQTIDPQSGAGNITPATIPNSRDITEANVPAPSCVDLTAREPR